MINPSPDGNTYQRLPSGTVKITIPEDASKHPSGYLSAIKNMLEQSLTSVETNDTPGIIIYSQTSPDTFSDNLKTLLQLQEEHTLQEQLAHITRLSLKIAQREKPIVAILHGSHLGAAFSWTLLADYRIACGANTATGFPETKYGLPPTLGAHAYLPPIVGDQQALHALTQGNTYSVRDGVDVGWINAVTNEKDALEKAEELIRDYVKKTTATKATEDDDKLADIVTQLERRANPHFSNITVTTDLIAARKVSSAAALLSAEQEAFITTLRKKNTVAVIRMQLFGVQEAREDRRADAFPTAQINKIGILGAGMMGSGIAYEVAKAGIDAVLKDVSSAAAEKGKSNVRKVIDKLIQRGLLTKSDQKDLLHRILATDDDQQLEGADLLIEAVYEDKELKYNLIKNTFPQLRRDGIFASNTTSLPITDLAHAADRPDQFIGLHFFSPVNRMPLVEVIRGKQTSEETLAKALQFVRRLNKVPIVVHDGPAFFTSRIFFHYLLEGITMLLEGKTVEEIDRAAVKAGFAVGPLAVLDEISLDLMVHVYAQLPTLHTSQQRACDYLSKMIAAGRHGRRSGKGFYEYPSDGSKKIAWMVPTFHTEKHEVDQEQIKNRLLHVVALDSYRCLEEGILEKTIDGDIGSVLGIGFAAHTGGVFSHIDQIGLRQFIDDCLHFQQYGEQWHIPRSLMALAKENFQFYTGLESNWER